MRPLLEYWSILGYNTIGQFRLVKYLVRETERTKLEIWGYGKK